MEFKPTKDQQRVIELFDSGKNIFLTGKGGTGKSWLTRYLIERAGGDILVCAPTGIAAQNIGGVTVHSAFKVPVRIIQPGEFYEVKPKRNGEYKPMDKVLRSAKIIIIDEISMCRIDVFEYIMRTIRNLGTNPQIVLVGDFYQLSPVLRTNPTNEKTDALSEAEIFQNLYGSRLYPFESEVWDGFVKCELQESLRQTDKVFIEALDRVREGVDIEQALPVLRQCQNDSLSLDAVSLCGRNKDAESINDMQLKDLIKSGKKESNIRCDIEGSVSPNEYPTAVTLTLCEGARVMMLTNDKDDRWKNGSTGTVREVLPAGVMVEIDGGLTCLVERYTWEFYEYQLVNEKKGGKVEKKIMQTVKGKFKQFPIRHAWAISIHKSQGQTYDKVNLDISAIFATGQLYVALSRCRSLEGLRIKGELTESKVMVSSVVRDFMKDRYIRGMEDATEVEIDRYKDGYDDGYRDGTNDAEERYQQRVAEDETVKKLSDFTIKQRERQKIENPEERNPKGAGRKRIASALAKPIRLPENIKMAMQEAMKIVKENPAFAEELETAILNCVTKFKTKKNTTLSNIGRGS